MLWLVYGLAEKCICKAVNHAALRNFFLLIDSLNGTLERLETYFENQRRGSGAITTKLFQLALQADQSVILSAVERYTRNIAEDVCKLYASINENGKRLLDLDNQVSERQERVEYWHANTSEGVRKVNGDVKVQFQESKCWHQDIREDTKELRNSQEKLEHREISWISSLDFSVKQNDIFGRRQKETAEWLFDNDVFKRWRSGAERILYCPGLPGASKSILVSTVINYLQQNDIAVAYIFCSYKEQEDHTTSNLLANFGITVD
ncbi:hypothetical protein AOQ84DRAFT_365778 [Glonium stellatum]|uniref:Nephrocystin 3-like N-terminal domain-containing protein n=1 Tax=Glonium stellatum TaxID=574774 RepID=A0A8E2EX35_9PEZI|nr:hypothetical protein AOQ84DRAFT_365778 [Glonium stellatum]